MSVVYRTSPGTSRVTDLKDINEEHNMRWSQTYIHTLRQDPADAEVVSHRLMVRAGFISKVAAGIYNYLPLATRSLAKLSTIVREEMAGAGSAELVMPAVQPAELWQDSGRWAEYGPELLRIKDRHDRDFCFGPTHEEVITDIVRGTVTSYKQLPVNMYQIQTKFRDEIRPRFGLMRGREFLMKDAYTFHADDEDLDLAYRAMERAYRRVFSRCGLRYTQVEADTGNIGGSESHEFMVLADTGEDAILSCPECHYGANVEKAETGALEAGAAVAARPPGAPREVDTPEQRTIEEVCRLPRDRTRPPDQDPDLRDRRGLRRGAHPRRSRGQRGQAQERARLSPPPARRRAEDPRDHRRAAGLLRPGRPERHQDRGRSVGHGARGGRHRRQQGPHPPGRGRSRP